MRLIILNPPNICKTRVLVCLSLQGTWSLRCMEYSIYMSNPYIYKETSLTHS